MRAAEALSLAYFLYLPLAGRLAGSRTPPGWVEVTAAALAALAAGLHQLGTGPVVAVARDWAPGAFLILAYWMSGPYVGVPAVALESRLLALDCRLIGPVLRGLARHSPRALLETLELAYLSCYAFVPAGLLWLVLAGAGEPDRFWTAVLVASLPCYALLPWLHTRPPWRAEGIAPIDRRLLFVRRLNMTILRHASVRANTFPSAHVASTVSAALMVAETLPVAGAGFLAVAAAIAVSTVAGRYHYGADAVLGVVLGVVGFLAGQM